MGGDVSRENVDAFVRLLEREEGPRALALVERLRSRLGARDVITDLLSPAQIEVGRRWEANEWNVGQEHAATSIVSSCLAALVTREGRPSRNDRMVMACAEGEWHGVPAAMASALLVLDGWTLSVLASSTPPRHLRRFLVQRRPKALLLSCTMATSLPAAAQSVEAAHDVGVPVLVGGAAFGQDDLRAVHVGADAWAPSAFEASRFLETWAPGAGPASRPCSEEYLELEARRPELLEAALGRLQQSLAADGNVVGGGGRLNVTFARGQLEWLLRFLGAALFVNDDRIFFEILPWMVRVSASRGLPTGLVPASLTTLSSLMRSTLPRARHLLDHGEGRVLGDLWAANHGSEADAEWAAAPSPANEGERLRVLRSYRILDTAPEAAFDDIAWLAAQLCGTPTGLVSFVDRDRQWFKARVGFEPVELARDRALGSYAILGSDLLVVPDARADHRFAKNPLVTGDPFIRFYAAAPLVTREGHVLGAVCVLDREPRQLGANQRTALRALAQQAMAQLDLRRARMAPRPRAPVGEGMPEVDGGDASRVAPVRAPDPLEAERQALLDDLLAARRSRDQLAGRLLRTREVAVLFGVSARTVTHWAAHGRIQALQTAGGHLRFPAADILELLLSEEGNRAN